MFGRVSDSLASTFDLNVAPSRQYYITDNELQASSGSGDCCPPVVDPKTWLVLVGFIALATYFLRIEVTMSMLMMARKRKRRSFTHISPPLDIINAGNEQN